MNRKSGVISNLMIPCLYTILAGVLLIIIGAPIYSYIEAKVQMIVVKGAPSYPNEYDSGVYDLIAKKKDISEVQIPGLDTLYGYIRSEEMDLNAPIYYGDSEEVLLQGAGHYVGSGLPGEGKPILIGGHDVTFFAPLEKVKVGDVIEISTNYGVYEYRVTDTKITDVTDTSAYSLTGEEEKLILYTCYPFGKVTKDRSGRFFVYGDLEVSR